MVSSDIVKNDYSFFCEIQIFPQKKLTVFFGCLKKDCLGDRPNDCKKPSGAEKRDIAAQNCPGV
ncbi:hypothetical protein BpHYR1_037650 [Brachionus plicatilis]|uniref:Uncharacterized protein n=1 Tax=Brachionus plicatilis TaxID=10195 RepID=A0A3M7RKI5_BRAPC|nr:hypothetical protein BpHYR1_037650 [Brachionus plicatilis]